MPEPQLHRMEALPREPRHRLLRPIDRVPADGMPNIRHVHPDLMGPPGLQTAPDMGEPLKPLQYLPVGHRIPPPVRHGHLLPIRTMPANRRVHSPAVLPQVPDHHRLICPCQTVVLKLCGQCLVRSIILCRNDQAAGVPVDAVDDAGAQRAPHAAEAPPAVVEQGVDQGPVRVPRRRVDHHPHRLIDHDDVLVLIDHIQRDILRQGVRRLRLRHEDLYRLRPAQFAALGRRPPVYRHLLPGNKPRRRGAGQLRQTPCQETAAPLRPHCPPSASPVPSWSAASFFVTLSWSRR